MKRFAVIESIAISNSSPTSTLVMILKHNMPFARGRDAHQDVCQSTAEAAKVGHAAATARGCRNAYQIIGRFPRLESKAASRCGDANKIISESAAKSHLYFQVVVGCARRWC